MKYFVIWNVEYEVGWVDEVFEHEKEMIEFLDKMQGAYEDRWHFSVYYGYDVYVEPKEKVMGWKVTKRG